MSDYMSILTGMLAGDGLNSLLIPEYVLRWNKINPLELSPYLTPEEALRQLPGIISSSLSLLEQIKDGLDEAYQHAKDACENAIDAYNKPVGILSNTEAIEALQNASKSSAQAIIALCLTQKLLFVQQQILVTCSRLLFICSSRDYKSVSIAIKELKAKIQGESGQKITDIAKQEFARMLQQLTQQMDVLERLERIEKHIGIHRTL